MAHLRRHNGKFCQRLSLSKKPFCQAGGRGSKLSTIRNGHPAAPGGLQRSLAHWAYFALLRPLGARFVRPPPLPPLPVSAKILRIFGRGNCKEAILLWKMGFSSAKIAPSPPYTPPGTIEVRKGFALLSRSPLSFLTVCGNGKFCQRLFRCMRSAKSSLCLGDFFLFNRTNLRGFDIS